MTAPRSDLASLGWSQGAQVDRDWTTAALTKLGLLDSAQHEAVLRDLAGTHPVELYDACCRVESPGRGKVE